MRWFKIYIVFYMIARMHSTIHDAASKLPSARRTVNPNLTSDNQSRRYIATPTDRVVPRRRKKHGHLSISLVKSHETSSYSPSTRLCSPRVVRIRSHIFVPNASRAAPTFRDVEMHLHTFIYIYTHTNEDYS